MPKQADGEPAYGIFRPDPEYLEEMRAAATKAIKTAGPDFGKAITALEAAVLCLPGPDLICRNALYYLTTFAGQNPEQDGGGVYPNQVELIQGLALRQTVDEMPPAVSLQEGADEVIEGAKAAMGAFIVLEMSRVERAPEAKKAKALALSEMRIYLASVRGQAYFDELVAVWRELFAPLDDGIHATLGVRIGDLITWWESVAAALEVRINRHFDRVRGAAGLPVDDNWAAAVEERFPRFPIPFDDEVREALADEERRRAFVWMVGDLSLLPVFTFDTDSLVELYPGDITSDALRGVLKSWSLAFGETKDTPLANFFLENPVTTKPLVRLSDDLYLWSNMQALAHSAQTLFEDLVAQGDGLKERYLRRRADFLEDSVADLMRTKFPTATVLTNMKWDYEDAEYESDVVVLVDAAVLIFECKGGRLAARSRVGRAGPVRADINKLIATPTEQAERLARLLEDGEGDLVVRLDGEEIPIDCSTIHRAITAGVTYEALASMLPNLGEVVEAGLTPEDVDALSFNLTLFDLRVILDILEHPCEVIHYLGRRNQLEMGQAFTGEETDLLGFYLETSFNLGEAEFGDDRHQIAGLSDPIDRYYYGLEAGLQVDKPQVRRNAWWEQLLGTVESRNRERWTDIGEILCNVAPEQQREFEEHISQLRCEIRGGERPPTDFFVLANGPPQRCDHLTGFIVQSTESTERKEQIEIVAKSVMKDDETVRRVLALGFPDEADDAPYLVLSLLDRRLSLPG